MPAALHQAVQFLQNYGNAEAQLNAEWLFSQALGCGRLELHLQRGIRLAPETLSHLEIQLRRLAAAEPLQYVLGMACFLGHEFKVDRRCLIPRPETELLAEWLIEETRPAGRLPDVALADVGTGSGCIIISLALARPGGIYHAIDIAPAALDLARENAARFGVADRIRFYQANLLSPMPPASLDYVVANPPYVSTDEWRCLPAQIRDYEPRVALDGGPQGLASINPLIAQAARALKPGGLLCMEIGAGQWPAVRQLLASHGFQNSQIRSDLAGHARFISARQP